MSLQDIFDDINSNYNKVKSLSDSIYTPYKSDIDQHWREADYYSRRAGDWIYTDWQYFNSAIYSYARNIVWLLDHFVDEMFLTTASVESSLQTIFNTYMARVVRDVINSVQYVETEMYQEIDFVVDIVNASISDLENYLNSEVDALHDEIDLLSIDVISWIDAAVANLADVLNIRIDEVNTNLTARIDFLETWTQLMVQAVYDYVDFLNAEMLAYVNEANSTLYFYIDARVKELDNYITTVQNSLNDRITIEVNALTDEIEAVEISLTDKINELIDTTTWNFTFFDLFTFTPELSLLRVLLRSDAEFERYKPYWQALFAKVLAED